MVSDKVVSLINCLNDSAASSLVTAYVLGIFRGEHPSEVWLNTLMTTIQSHSCLLIMVLGQSKLRLSFRSSVCRKLTVVLKKPVWDLCTVTWLLEIATGVLINRWTRSAATLGSTAVVKQCSVDLCWENFPKDQMIFFPIIFFFPVLASQSQLESFSVVLPAARSSCGHLLLLPISFHCWMTELVWLFWTSS